MHDLTAIVHRCNPQSVNLARITWLPGIVPAESWRVWLETFFAPVVLPHFLRIYQCAQQPGLRELRAAIATFGQQLSPAQRLHSLEAGKVLVYARPPKGDRLQERFLTEVRAGSSEGYFPTLFALRAAGFALPMRTSALAYAAQELILHPLKKGVAEELISLAAVPVNAVLLAWSSPSEGGWRHHA